MEWRQCQPLALQQALRQALKWPEKWRELALSWAGSLSPCLPCPFLARLFPLTQSLVQPHDPLTPIIEQIRTWRSSLSYTIER